jgi:hypothetical protein
LKKELIKQEFLRNPERLIESLQNSQYNQNMSSNNNMRYGTKGSLSITRETGYITDFETDFKGDCIAFTMNTQGINFLEAVDYIGSIYGIVGDRENKFEPREKQEKTKKPQKIKTDKKPSYWNEKNVMAIINNSTSIKNTPGGLYLQSRYCYFESENIRATRLYCITTKRDEHCLVSIIRDYYNYDNILGIHRIFITENGKKIEKKMANIDEKKGIAGAYPCIFLESKKEFSMSICEGLETALSVLKLGLGTNIISCLNSVNFGKFHDIELYNLNIFLDQDKAGINARFQIEANYLKENKQTNINIEKVANNFNDFNDLLKSKKETKSAR